MLSIKALVATGAIVASTVGGAYATGVVNKNGHEVNDHAAHGQSVAAAARAQHDVTETASADPSEASDTPESTDTATAGSTETAAAEPTEAAETDEASETAEPSETADPSETATAAPVQHRGWTQGKHVGWTKKGKHLGVGHGTGAPTTPAQDTTAHAAPSHPAHTNTHHAR